MLKIKVLSIKGCAATELKFCETSFAQIEKGRDGEWNKKRNLAPGFIREEETRVSCCYLRCVIGRRGGGGRGCVSGQIHTRENGERGPRERQEEHFTISILFCFSSFWNGRANLYQMTKSPILTINFKVFCLRPG